MKLRFFPSRILARAKQPAFSCFSARRCESFKAHVLNKVNQSTPAVSPFDHLFIEGIFPSPLYHAIKTRMYYYKYHAALQNRYEAGGKLINRRYNLIRNSDPETHYLRAIFSDPAIKRSLLEKFYLEPSDRLARSLEIHQDFEYTYTAAGRIQNIHIDMPPKFLSFIFYFPENPVSQETEGKNGTILYDKNLMPHYRAKYKPNSLCIFAPHFYSYHGVSSKIDRGTLIIFYASQAERALLKAAFTSGTPPCEALKDRIQAKLKAHPLLGYGRDSARILEERSQCLINTPQGRVMVDEQR